METNHTTEKAGRKTPTISMRDFFALPEVIAAQNVQKANRHGSATHRTAHETIVAIAAQYGAKSYFSGY